MVDLIIYSEKMLVGHIHIYVRYFIVYLLYRDYGFFFGCYKMKNYGVGVSRIETITHQKIRIETIKPNSNN